MDGRSLSLFNCSSLIGWKAAWCLVHITEDSFILTPKAAQRHKNVMVHPNTSRKSPILRFSVFVFLISSYWLVLKLLFVLSTSNVESIVSKMHLREIYSFMNNVWSKSVKIDFGKLIFSANWMNGKSTTAWSSEMMLLYIECLGTVETMTRYRVTFTVWEHIYNATNKYSPFHGLKNDAGPSSQNHYSEKLTEKTI